MMLRTAFLVGIAALAVLAASKVQADDVEDTRPVAVEPGNITEDTAVYQNADDRAPAVGAYRRRWAPTAAPSDTTASENVASTPIVSAAPVRSRASATPPPGAPYYHDDQDGAWIEGDDAPRSSYAYANGYYTAGPGTYGYSSQGYSYGHAGIPSGYESMPGATVIIEETITTYEP